MKRMLWDRNMARVICAGICLALLNLGGGIGEEARAQALKTNQIVKPTSFEEWLILAKGGDTNAQYLLGRSYTWASTLEKPIAGVPRDAEAGHAWFLRAASGGVAEAQYEAGHQFYRKAMSAREKKKQAELVQASLMWLTRAALQGNVDACIALSLGYDSIDSMNGVRGGVFGIELIEAYKWIHLALEAEHKLPPGNRAYVTRNRLSGKLTGIQVAQAKERAVRFIEAMEKAKKEKAQAK
jgi:TPR repeat protein